MIIETRRKKDKKRKRELSGYVVEKQNEHIYEILRYER